MKLFLDTNVLITINDNDFKNADQSRIEILTPSAFVDKYINV
jgi:predicted nucleic acid-binding protein